MTDSKFSKLTDAQVRAVLELACEDLEERDMTGHVFSNKLDAILSQPPAPSPEPYQPGDRVRVTRGRYEGREFTVERVSLAPRTGITWLHGCGFGEGFIDADFVEKVSFSPAEAAPNPFSEANLEKEWLGALQLLRERGADVDKMLASGAEAIAYFVKNPSPVDFANLDADEGPESRIIRSGDLEVGRRYRIVEIEDCDKFPAHSAGDEFVAQSQDGRLSTCWAVHSGRTRHLRNATYVTAVEPVAEPEQSPQPVMTSMAALSMAEIQHQAREEQAADPAIIHADEGVVLEAGEYETAGVPYPWKFRVTREIKALRSELESGWHWSISNTEWVTAVRRVEAPKADSAVEKRTRAKP